MAVPDFQSLMLPVLKLLQDGEPWRAADINRALAENLGLTPEDLEELLPSGKQTRYTNRCAWAKAHLAHAGLLDRVTRGVYRLAPRGQEVIDRDPDRITLKLLSEFQEYRDFREGTNTKHEDSGDQEEATTPIEQIEAGYQSVRKELAQELLATVHACSPVFFEQLVIDLLVAMGYGGSHADAAHVGRSGDGGIDGIIKEDRLGLDAVYVQAKRWEGPVGRPDVQAFVGSLESHRAKKGVFITTSYFTKLATECVDHIDKRIVLIDGERLAELMIEVDVGVSPVDSYVVKRLDVDYFEEE